VIREDLELRIRYVPILVGRALLEDLLILDHVVDLVLSIPNLGLTGDTYMPDAML